MDADLADALLTAKNARLPRVMRIEAVLLAVAQLSLSPELEVFRDQLTVPTLARMPAYIFDDLCARIERDYFTHQRNATAATSAVIEAARLKGLHS